MLKRNIAFLLTLIIMLGILTAAPTSVSAKSTGNLSETGAKVDLAATGWSIPSEKTFVNRLAQLKKKYYPSGYSGAYYEDGHAMAWQCYGFACLMLKEVFGIKYYADGFVNKADYTMGTIYAGDIVRIRGNSHSIFITKVTSKGYYFCDANWDYNNGVRWDAFFTKAEMASTFTYKIHVPGSMLVGSETASVDLYAQTPVLLSATPTSSGIEVKWNSVKDASAYRVYYKVDDANAWKASGKTTKTSYVFNTNLEYTKKYTFTVRALDPYDTLISNYNKTGVSCEYRLPPPEMKSAKATISNIKVTWSAVKGVSLYRLFYKLPADKKWRKLSDVKGTTYNFKKGTPYTTYRFTVLCLNSKKQVISGTSANIVSAQFFDYNTQLAIPVSNVPAPTKTLGKIQVSWSAVKGAKRYVVFASKNGATTGWKKIATTTKTAICVTGCKNKGKYRYTVRCIDNKGKFISGYKPGTMLYYFDYPTKLYATKVNNDGKIKVSWKGITAAPAYMVYYKTNLDQSWKAVNTKAITGTSVTFNGAQDGVTYTFIVRVCDKQMTRHLSGYLEAGVSITYSVPAPETEPPTEEMTEDPTVNTDAPEETAAPADDPTDAPAEDPTQPVEDPTNAPAEDPTKPVAENPTGDPATEPPTADPN